jgi:hypothetical protein
MLRCSPGPPRTNSGRLKTLEQKLEHRPKTSPLQEALGDQVRQRCAAAENAGGTAVDRLTGLLDAYFGMAFELFSRSEHMPELEETFSTLARARIGDLNT